MLNFPTPDSNAPYISAPDAPAPKKSPVKKILIALAISAAFLIGYMLIQLAVSAVFMAVLTFMAAAVNPQLAVAGNAENPDALRDYVTDIYMEHVAEIFIISGVLMLGIIFLVLLLTCKKGRWQMAKILRLPERMKGGRGFGVLALCFAAGLMFNAGFVALIELIPFPESWLEANNESVGAIMRGSILAAILATSVIAPLVEELLFRGIFYTSLRDAIPGRRRAAMLIAGAVVSVVFGIYHGNILQGIYTCAFSVLLVAIYEMTGSVWGPVAMHMGFNSSWIISWLLLIVFNVIGLPAGGAIFLAISAALVVGIFLLTVHGQRHAAGGNDRSGDPAYNSDLAAPLS